MRLFAFRSGSLALETYWVLFLLSALWKTWLWAYLSQSKLKLKSLDWGCTSLWWEKLWISLSSLAGSSNNLGSTSRSGVKNWFGTLPRLRLSKSVLQDLNVRSFCYDHMAGLLFWFWGWWVRSKKKWVSAWFASSSGKVRWVWQSLIGQWNAWFNMFWDLLLGGCNVTTEEYQAEKDSFKSKPVIFGGFWFLSQFSFDPWYIWSVPPLVYTYWSKTLRLSFWETLLYEEAHAVSLMAKPAKMLAWFEDWERGLAHLVMKPRNSWTKSPSSLENFNPLASNYMNVYFAWNIWATWFLYKHTFSEFFSSWEFANIWIGSEWILAFSMVSWGVLWNVLSSSAGKGHLPPALKWSIQASEVDWNFFLTMGDRIGFKGLGPRGFFNYWRFSWFSWLLPFLVKVRTLRNLFVLQKVKMGKTPIFVMSSVNKPYWFLVGSGAPAIVKRVDRVSWLGFFSPVLNGIRSSELFEERGEVLSSVTSSKVLAESTLKFWFSLGLASSRRSLSGLSLYLTSWALWSSCQQSLRYSSSSLYQTFIFGFMSWWSSLVGYWKLGLHQGSSVIPLSSSPDMWASMFLLKFLLFLRLFIWHWNRLPWFLFYASFWVVWIQLLFKKLFKFLPKSWSLSGFWWPGMVSNWLDNPGAFAGEYTFHKEESFNNVSLARIHDFEDNAQLWGIFNWRGPELMLLGYSDDDFLPLVELVWLGIPLVVIVAEETLPLVESKLAADLVYWVPVGSLLLQANTEFGLFYWYYWFFKLLVSMRILYKLGKGKTSFLKGEKLAILHWNLVSSLSSTYYNVGYLAPKKKYKTLLGNSVS